VSAPAKAATCDLAYKQTVDKPVEVEVLAITKASGISVMKAFKKDGKMVKEWIETLPQEELSELENGVANGASKDIEVDGKRFTLTAKELQFERKLEKQNVKSFMPGVIEPSFGIDRIFACILEHAYYARPKGKDDDQALRGVLSLAADIAPYKCTILPLDQRIARHGNYAKMMESFRAQLAARGLSYTIDDSGATVGRRYARNDELGIPFAITVDFDSLEDSTVTLRERDSTHQARLKLDDVADVLRALCSNEVTWVEIQKKYSPS
jgi:glycyl-tRNA synthetase